MNKNTRTLLITVISFAVVITIAAVAYNALKQNAPAVSFTPTIAVTSESTKAEPAKPVEPTVVTDPAPTGGTVSDEPSSDVQADDGAKSVMPNLPLTRLDGTMTSVHDVRAGKPTVINYFASWCPPCKQELPHFQKAFDEYGDQISFIFLDALDGQRETLKTINAFIKDFPFTGPVFYDKGEFAMTFQTNSLPTTVFLDKEGRVVKGYLGFVPEEVLYVDIAELLN